MISVFMSISLWAQVAVLDILHIFDCLGQVNAGVYMFCIWVELPVQRRLCPIFLRWSRVTRPPLVFRGLTGSQRTPGF